MSPDNSHTRLRASQLSDVKIPLEVDPPTVFAGCGEQSMPLRAHKPSLSSKERPSRRSMSSFVPRPFPPPSLSDVPVEYIIDQLHNLAPHYWNKPATSDCTIFVPVPQARGGMAMHTPDTPSSSPELSPAQSPSDPSNMGRRATEPALQCTPRISLKLHMDYLSSQSTFLRGLFSGASPLDLINTTPTSPPTFNTTAPAQPGPFHVPANRQPRLLPSSPNHPVIYLPVPDPTSFHLLVHWMYFGETSHIEDCLTQGLVQWEGLARNVEYLGLPSEIKVFLGRWYGHWLSPGRARSGPFGFDEDTDYESDDSDDGDCVSVSSSDDYDPQDFQRGRTQAVHRAVPRPSLSSHRPHSA